MGSKRKHYGKCRVCGKTGKLTFEHIPPKVAFNRHPIAGQRILNLINVRPSNYPSYVHRDYQGGFGRHALCAKCNNGIGSKYAAAFGQWATQCLEIVGKINAADHLIRNATFDIYPLRVIKQICLMFLCFNDEEFGAFHPDIAAFVSDPHRRRLPPNIRISAYILQNLRLRFARGMVPKAVEQEELNPNRILALIDEAEETMANWETPTEIAFPPLGYAMTFGGDKADRQRASISRFSEYGFDDRETVVLDLPVLPVHTWYYGDYRSLAEIESHADEGRRR